MDYRVIAIMGPGGSVLERGCATETDIENFVVSMLRLYEPSTANPGIGVTFTVVKN